MEALLEEHEKLGKRGSLSKSLGDVQKTIDLLVKARESIVNSKHSIFYTSFDYLNKILNN